MAGEAEPAIREYTMQWKPGERKLSYLVLRCLGPPTSIPVTFYFNFSYIEGKESIVRLKKQMSWPCFVLSWNIQRSRLWVKGGSITF